MSEIKYPYLPPGRSMRFVSIDDEFMAEAKRAREECSGDPLYPVGCVLVKDGKILVRAGNGYNRGAGGVHVCPRIVLECPSGTGYDLCHLHDSPGHAETMLIAAAKEQGIETQDADVYLCGHWWCCEPCWNVMIEAGVRDVYLLENAHGEFDRDRVYGETLKSSVKSVYLEGVEIDELKRACEELGCTVFSSTAEKIQSCDVLVASIPCLEIPFEKPIVLVSKKDSIVSENFLKNPAVVYHVEYETIQDACRMLKNVLRQL